MQSLPPARAARDMSAAVDYLANHDASISGHMAEHDTFFPPAAAHALEAKLKKMGKQAALTVHPGTGYAFMGPHNALGTLNATLAAEIWPKAVAFLHDTLAGPAKAGHHVLPRT
jgi:dienelactone hydrolase